jgi:beta-fructofuranosidase
MTSIFYRPQDAAVGDVIPFYANGEFKIFYLQLWRVANAPETTWYLLGTRDLVHYQEYGSCQVPGGTGAVIKANGLYHLFSCIFPENRQIICHATSADLVHWEQHPEHNFEADPVFYDPIDWRDPFVFWNEEEGLYWMLMAARARSPYQRGGCIGLCVSYDLITWQARPPLYAPDLYISALECPDLFQMGEWWYLIYSTYTDRFVTHYRLSRSLSGPWLCPAEDAFDGRAFYAAKTISDGHKRYLCGWNPTRTENHFNWNPPGYEGKDYNTYDWGGNLVMHEVVQAGDGTLHVRLPDTVAAMFAHEQSIELQRLIGDGEINKNDYQATSPVGFACATVGPLPTCCLVSAQFRFEPDTRRLGLMLRTADQLDRGYTIQIEPDRDRVVFKTYAFSNEHGGKILPYEVEMERPLALQPHHTYSIKLVIEDTICEIYLNDEVALSARMYDLPAGNLVFFVADGEAVFSDIIVKTL